MLGYWKSPEATEAVLKDGWYWSGDVVRVDERGLYHVVDRRKEMMKYKGFSIAPAEVEGVLLEHPAVRDCGVVSRVDEAARKSHAHSLYCARAISKPNKPQPPCANMLANGSRTTRCRAKYISYRAFHVRPRARFSGVICVNCSEFSRLAPVISLGLRMDQNAEQVGHFLPKPAFQCSLNVVHPRQRKVVLHGAVQR